MLNSFSYCAHQAHFIANIWYTQPCQV